MFRTKQAVDRHVRELFQKVKGENERNLRCYNIAKLYFQVGEYEWARRYVSSYLEVKGDQAGPHKLLGQIYENLGQKESALAQYQQSLELEGRQDDLVLKVCELLADRDVVVDANRVKYWLERADEKFPHHSTVFQLKEKMLTISGSSDGGEDLEALIAAELSARPLDVQLRVKLLKYYMDKSRLDDAYKHAVQVESTYAHRDSVAWYEALCDLLSKCKNSGQPTSFWILYVSSLERCAALSLKEQGHVLKKTIPEAAQAVFNFDQALTEAKLQNFPNNATFADHMFNHMWGQLHYHLACLLLRKTKREQGSWGDAGRLCGPLLLSATHVAPLDPGAPWTLHLKDQLKTQIQVWHREGSYRCSQASHVLEDYARDDVKRLMDKIDKFSVGAWRERIYQRIFVSRAHKATSYFCNHAAPNPPLRLSSTTELNRYDRVAEEVWPASLHHHVWLGVLDRPRKNRSINHNGSNNENQNSIETGPLPHRHCHVFPDLQLSVSNLSQAAPDSLGQLDIDAFLNAAVLCASVTVEEQQRSGFLSPDRLPTLPADITNTLCTCTQEKWWSSAYKIYRKQDGISGDLGEIRQELQRGLEVVRCIGNHGLHPVILVHLARIFNHKAKVLKDKDKNHSDLPFVEARCELYWSAVVPLLERLLNNQTIRTTSTKIFDYQGKEMNNVELSNALEEGRLLLAQRHVREKQYEEAIEALQALKCPEASFMQGESYKSLADELMSNLPKESLTSAMRSQHIVMLTKARNCYYLTLDRLRSPGMNPKHPLNSELGSRIADIENDLKRIDPDLGRGDSNRNECDGMSEESYSSVHSGEQPIIQNTYTGVGSVAHTLGTPQRNPPHRNTPKQTSTPCRPQHQDVLELTRKSAQHQQEARPSPERLDAQIRQLIHSKDNMIQTILEQNKMLLETSKNLVESNKTLSDKLDSLQKEFVNFRIEAQSKQQPQTPLPLQQQQQQQRRQSISTTNQNNLDEDLYVLGDEDYAELNFGVTPSGQPQAPQPTPQIPANLFEQPQRNPYSPFVYPQPAIQGYYQGTLPYNEVHPQHIPSLFPPNVYQMPALYPRGTIDQSLGCGMPKTPDNLMGQGLFTRRLLNQLTDLVPMQQHSVPQVPQPVSQVIPQVVPQVVPLPAPLLSMQLQNVDITRIDIPAKDGAPMPLQTRRDTPVSGAPPVNVVITTSDTLPTTVPTVQPTLSVTIPAQHRANSGIASTVGSTTSTSVVGSAPHSYQISMPSQATIPTTVNLPPLSTTITNTISATVAEQERNRTVNSSVLSTGSHNYSGDGPELEHDPLPDFVPVIPLPAEVKVTTGEEDETSLFCARAKLYRWADKEWKERGIGNVKLLRNKEGRVRLVMRREQVLKICANHMLKPEMELTQMINNERAWIWVANDFADEQVKLEKLCIKFKHVEEAQAFKESFDKAKSSMPIEPTGTAPATKLITSDNTKTETTSGPVMVGGFSFTSKPIIRTPATPEPEPRKSAGSEEPAKPSPFAGFSFTRPSDTSAPNSGFSFIKPISNPIFSSPTITETATPDSSLSITAQPAPPPLPPASTISSARSSLRRPHAPAPAEIAHGPTGTLDLKVPISGTVNQDGEVVLYEKNETVMRCPVGSSDWKTRGPGSVKIILNPTTGQVRLYLRHNEKNEVLGIQILTATTKLTPILGHDNVITWIHEITNDGAPKSEYLAAVFDTAAQASEYSSVVGSIQRLIKDNRVPASCIRRDGETVRLESAKPSFAELAKPAPGSWECEACYTRNDASAGKCIACLTVPPGRTERNVLAAEKPAATLAEQSSLWLRFKPQADSWECQSCYTRNTSENTYCVACDAPKDPTMPPKPKTTGFTANTSSSAPSIPFAFGIPPAMTPKTSSLSEMFKPAAGSWECQGCFLRNEPTVDYCAACEAPRDASMPPKPKTKDGIFGLATNGTTSAPTFSFGIPQPSGTGATTANSSTGFTFKMPTTDDGASGEPGKPVNLSVFGTTTRQTRSAATDLVFGMPQRVSTPPSSDAKFVFGSPGKSFDFHLPKSPIKSPNGTGARGENSEDEVAESEDVYFAPVIPLPDKIEVKTGEEDEQVLYTHRAKLFRYDANSKEWKERGLGDIKLLRHNVTKKLRMVMRRDQTLKLCLNHVVPMDLELKPKDDKTWLWNAADYSEGDIEYLQLACRFKTPEIAGRFKQAVESALSDDNNLETSEENVRTEKPADTESSPLRDIQVVYELKVTPEERAAALKLQLPENFYAYKQKDDCPGCLGCRVPEVPLFATTEAKLEVPKVLSKTLSSPSDHSGLAAKTTPSGTAVSPNAPKIAPPKFTCPPSSTKSTDSSVASTTPSLFGGEFVQKTSAPFTTDGSSLLTKDAASKDASNKSTGFVFGTALSLNRDDKPNLFSTGTTSSTDNNNETANRSGPFTSNAFTIKDLNICSPSSTGTQQQPFEKIQSLFATGQTSIFSGVPSGGSIFGGNTTAKLQTESTTESASADSKNPPSSSTFQNIFGGSGKSTSSITSSTKSPIFGAGLTQPTFGMGVSSNTNIFRTGAVPDSANPFSTTSTQAAPKLSFGSLASIGSSVSSSTDNGTLNNASVRPSKESEETANKTDAVTFLPLDNTTTFSALAAQGPQQPAFQRDPNFSFAGAGTSVFGTTMVAPRSDLKNTKNPVVVTPKKDAEKDQAEDENENDNENENDPSQEHDPHFEPIIPLPDTIEVRTGEEDEEKVFCQRAKLYRFESDTKEWKERGVGEMKLLHHVEHGTYRLLLRREQVYKVVCNQLLSPDLTLKPLYSSDRAWVWAGINHAEEPFGPEELAVRFKTAELANEFKEAVDKARADLLERRATGQGRTNESTETSECYAEEQEDEADEEDEDDEDEDVHSTMFLARAELVTLQEPQRTTWTSVGAGLLKILYDSDIYGAKIILEEETSGEILSITIISIETTMEVNENTCVWTAVDEVLDPPARRTLKAIFDSVQFAQEMHMNFQDGQEYAKQADISEAAFYDHIE